jgi:hypothetical protein
MHPTGLPVFDRSLLIMLFKNGAEITGIGEPDQMGYIDYFQLRIPEQLLGLFKTQSYQIITEILADMRLEHFR